MFRPRVIPCLLLKNKGLVKSVRFKDYRYIGDPMNAVKIFNDKKADELVFLDIDATSQGRLIDTVTLKKIADEANMPFGVGGGIKTIEDIRNLLNSGAEKVIINSAGVKNPSFIREASEEFGSSTIVVCMDVKKQFIGGYKVVIENGRKNTNLSPFDFAKIVEELGAGEIIINSIDHDGMMDGYDLDLVKRISNSVSVPTVALGGAGNYHHFKEAIVEGNASAVAAGSLFVYHGPRRAVLISFPTKDELSDMFN